MKWARRILCSSLFIFLSCREPSTEQTQSPTKPKNTPVTAANEEEFFLPRAESIKGRRAPERDEGSVRLKLRRDPKDGYTWELSGNSVSEVLKVDKQLRRELLSKGEVGKGKE